jgi:hypothetical protein
MRRELKKKKGGALRQGAPLKATRGGGRGRRKRWAGTATETETTGEAVGMDKAVATAIQIAWRSPDASVRTVGLTGEPHVVLIFSNLSKIDSILKIQNGCLILL